MKFERYVSQEDDFKGYMTKAELSRLAQPLADKSFIVPDPGCRYTAWSSTSTLISKVRQFPLNIKSKICQAML